MNNVILPIICQKNSKIIIFKANDKFENIIETINFLFN